MFGNLKVHVIDFPTGKFGFVGTLPAVLGTAVPATTADVMGGRAFTAPGGEIVTLKFPSFDSWEDAVKFAASKGVAVNVSISNKS